eukprot:763192-Hanusia_phi.AAC.4
MALAVVALFLSPGDALAAKSGGRVAGSGFRAGVAARSSMKSSSVRSAVKSPAQRQIGNCPSLLRSGSQATLGVSDSRTGLSPFGLRPFFYAPLLTDVVVLGGVAYAGAMAYNMFENARQGRTSGINIAKVQVAVRTSLARARWPVMWGCRCAVTTEGRALSLGPLRGLHESATADHRCLQPCSVLVSCRAS